MLIAVRVVSYFETLLEKDDTVPPIRNANPEKRMINPRITMISASHLGILFFSSQEMGCAQTILINNASKNGEMISSWTMPFQKTCKLSFTNYGKHNIKIRAKVGLTSYKWNSTSMYFGACWHEYYQVNTRTTDDKKIDLNFVNIKGKGVYVGDEICLFNTSYEWWGEGDEKIFVDGEAFPSSFGTGTEDYYGYAFGRPQPFSHPFISQPVGDGNEGNSNNGGITINMRHRSLDAIPFNNSISSNIELWHWAKAKVNYALTSYFYVQFPFELNIKPDEKSVQNRVARFTSDFEKTVK